MISILFSLASENCPYLTRQSFGHFYLVKVPFRPEKVSTFSASIAIVRPELHGLLHAAGPDSVEPLEDIAPCGLPRDAVAAVHYMYMREYWVQVHKSPIVYRYVDWSITVPLQMIEFNLILKAAQKPVTSNCFWWLFLGTVVIVALGR